ncbi:MAG: glycosyltransferase, partial [Flavobacteriales bacterium]|nr:glycosyltransferase [Flavobacteriales bacterium]
DLIQLNKLAVTYCGILEISELTDKLSQFHLFVSPTLGENFGHSILESLNASTPVLISDKTPWRNLEEESIGFDLPLNNKEVWLEKLNLIFSMSNEVYQLWRKGAWQRAQTQLNQIELKEKYIQLFS